MVSEPSGLLSHNSDLGHSGHRSGSKSSKHKMAEISFKGHLPIGGRDRLLTTPLELPAILCVPSNTSDSEVPSPAQKINMVIAGIPFWPRRPWFTTLLQLNTENPLPLSITPDLLSHGQFLHPSPEKLHLTGWRLKGLGFLIRDVLEKWWKLYSKLERPLPTTLTRES